MPESLFICNKTGSDKLEGDKWKGDKEIYNYLQKF